MENGGSLRRDGRNFKPEYLLFPLEVEFSADRLDEGESEFPYGLCRVFWVQLNLFHDCRTDDDSIC